MGNFSDSKTQQTGAIKMLYVINFRLSICKVYVKLSIDMGAVPRTSHSVNADTPESEPPVVPSVPGKGLGGHREVIIHRWMSL